MVDISKICERHKVRALYAFGSVLTPAFSQDSDIDLIVEFSIIDLKITPIIITALNWLCNSY